MRVAVRPEMLRWARDRAGLDALALAGRFPRLQEWETEEARPTFKQLESYAKATHTPLGYFFLPAPPEEALPIPDFRTIRGQEVRRPSPDLLEMIYVCQRRQDWYRDYCRANGFGPLEFVGSVDRRMPVPKVAALIRQALGFDLEARRACPTWEDALRVFIADADQAGVMVMCSGVVMNNNRRRLDPQEFRGFALADDLAPLVFINGADSKAAQMFTLAHELAHLWLGQTALSSANLAESEEGKIEPWCNAVAAELLVPADVMRSELVRSEPTDRAMTRFARRFKVSTLVVLRRLHDVEALSRDEFIQQYARESARLAAISKAGGGGNFYLSQAARVSKRFARAVVVSTVEGQTLYRDAMKMLGVSKVETFRELGHSLDIPV